MKTKFTKLISSCLSVIFATTLCFNNVSALANPNPNTVSQNNSALHATFAAAQTGVMNHPVDVSAILHNVLNESMNLNSIIHDISANSLANFHNVSIEVGNNAQAVTNTTYLTPAEAIAVNQALNGHQSLVLDALGQATSGSFNFASLPTNATNLLIPANVVANDNNASFNLSGSLANFGDIYVSSSASNHNAAAISLENLYNGANALITTNAQSGVSTPTDLTINVSNDFINAGTISSSHNLTVTTGADLMNYNTGALIASNDLTATVGSGYLQNNGLIDAVNGNLSITSGNTDLFAVNGVTGNFESGQNVTLSSNSSATNNSNFLVYGGDYSAGSLKTDSVSLNGSKANDYFVVDNINGQFNTSGHNFGIISFGNLNLNNFAITGDPLIAASGNIVLPSTNIYTGGYDLVVIAGGNITANPNTSIVIDTSITGYAIVNDTSQVATVITNSGQNYNVYNGGSGNVTLIAGSNFTAPFSYPGVTNALTLTGGNATGGYVNLNGVSLINTQAYLAVAPPSPPSNYTNVNPNFNGGNVIIAAYAGSELGSGTVSLASTTGPSTIITTGAINNGVNLNNISNTGSISQPGSTDPAMINGFVTIIAGSLSNTSTPAITTGEILTTPSNLGGIISPTGTYYGGQVTLLNQTPNLVNTSNQIVNPYFSYVSPLNSNFAGQLPIQTPGSNGQGADAPQLPTLIAGLAAYPNGRGNPFTNVMALTSGAGSGFNNSITINGSIITPGSNVSIAGIGDIIINGSISTGSQGVTIYSASNIYVGAGSYAAVQPPIGTFEAGITATSQLGNGTVTLETTGGLNGAQGYSNIYTAGQILAQNINIITQNNGGFLINASPNSNGAGIGVINESNILINLNGSGSVQASASSILFGTNLTFISGSGSFGSSTSEPLNTNIVYGSFNTAGSVFVNNGLKSNIANEQTVQINQSTASVFSFANNGNISVFGNITASGYISLNSAAIYNGAPQASNGSIILGSAILTAPSVAITANGNGDINEIAGEIVTTNLYISSNGGSIGSLTNPIVTNASYAIVPAQYSANVSASTTSTGNIYINDVASVTQFGNPIIIVAGATANSYSLTAATANISLLGQINASTISFNIPTGYFNVNGGSLFAQTVAGGNGGTINLTANSINFSGGNLQLVADALGNGNGGNITLDLTGNLPLFLGQQAGEVYLQANGGSAGSSSGNAGTVTINTLGSIYSGANPITVTPLGVNGNGGNIYINTAGLLYYGSAINVSGVGSGAGGIINFVVNSQIPFNVGNPALDSNGVAGSIVSDSGLQSISGGGSISINNLDGGFVNTSPIIGAVVNITVGSNSQLQVGNTIGSFVSSPSPLVPPGQTTLTSNGNGSIVELSPQPYVIGNIVNLISTSANIGYGALVVNAGVINVNTAGAASVYNVGQTLSLTSNTGAGFIFQGSQSAGIQNINTGVNGGPGGNIIVSDLGTLTFLNNAHIITGGYGGGSVNIYNWSSSPSAAIYFYYGVNISTHSQYANSGQGYVSVSMGAFNATNNTNPNAGSIQIQNNGVNVSSYPYVYFGTNGITAAGPGNILNFKGSAIILDTGTHAASSIVLGGFDTITADPVGFNGSIPASLNVPGLGVLNGNAANANNVNSNSAPLTADYSIFSSPNSILNTNTLISNPLNTNDSKSSYAEQFNMSTGYNNDESEDNMVSSNIQTILPIAYTTSVNNKVAQVLDQNSDVNLYKLNNGALLIHTDKNTQIVGKNAKLNLKANTLALVVSNQHGITVYNLIDKSANSVVLTVNNDKIAINPGQCIAIAHNMNSDFSLVNPLTKVGYRSEQKVNTSGVNLIKADYSIITLINSVPAVKALLHSHDAKVKHLVNDLYKASAIIYQSNMAQGMYHQVSHPKTVAMR